MLEEQIRKIIPSFKKVTYEPDLRQKIAQSWPAIMDCESLKNDIGVIFDYGFEKSIEELLKDIKSN